MQVQVNGDAMELPKGATVATLIEKMEEEGVISRPNSKGQREVLVGEDATT